MKIIIDGNVILDVLQNREPFVQSSSKVLRLVETRQIKGYITTNSVTDIYNVLKHSVKDKQRLYIILDRLFVLVKIINVKSRDIKRAFRPEVNDFESELMCVCAERKKIDYIITRNTELFRNCLVPAITPEDFLAGFFDNIQSPGFLSSFI
jgi:predicted nucleic acid-binding protein